MQYSKDFEESVAAITEDDPGFKQERDYRRHRGLPELTLEEYKDILFFREKDDQQMIDMGR